MTIHEEAARSYWLTAPNAADTAKLARDHVAGLLCHTGHGGLAETARLLASEVVTNVFAHTRVPFVTVETTVGRERVRIAVHDASGRRPLVREMAAENEHGRGLQLVALLSAAWGVACGPIGKRTWFELAAG